MEILLPVVPSCVVIFITGISHFSFPTDPNFSVTNQTLQMIPILHFCTQMIVLRFVLNMRIYIYILINIPGILKAQDKFKLYKTQPLILILGRVGNNARPQKVVIVVKDYIIFKEFRMRAMAGHVPQTCIVKITAHYW